MAFTINEFVFKVILPILVGVAILTSLNSIKTESLDPKVDSLEDVLGSMGRSVTFADNSGNPWDETSTTKAEFRDAVVYNMFIAQNCRFIPRIDGMEAADNFKGISSGEVYYPLGLKKPFTTQKNQGELSSTCAGGKQALELPELDFDQGLKDSETNDMEGRYGRVNFNFRKNYTLSNPKIAAFSFDIPRNFFSSPPPDLWTGERMVAAVPEEIEYRCSNHNRGIPLFPSELSSQTTAQDGSDSIRARTEVYGGGNLGFFAYRLRISSSVPKIKESSQVPDGAQLSICGAPGQNRLKNFLYGYGDSEPLKYVFCSGSSGYIQSNAGRPDSSSEAANPGIQIGSGSDYLVFPKITVRKGATKCIDQFMDRGEELDSALPLKKLGECSFKDVRNGRTAEFNQQEVKCGLSSRNIQIHSGGELTYYSTTWLTPSRTCESSISVSVEEGNSVISNSGSIILDRGEVVSLRSSSSNIQQLTLEMNVEGLKSYRVIVSGENSEVVILENTNQHLNGDGYDIVRQVRDGEGSERKEFWAPGDSSDSARYNLKISKEGDKVRFENLEGNWEDSRFAAEIPDQIKSIKIERLEGASNSGSLEIKNFECSSNSG